MTPEPAIHAPRKRWRRWLFARWFIVVLVGVLGYGAWREYDFRVAIKEAKALGWEWTYDDPFEGIQKNWRAAFRKATWLDGKRDLVIRKAEEFVRHARLVRRLAPKYLFVAEGSEVNDLSVLEGLSMLERLYIGGCTALTNVDALKGLPKLRVLDLSDCTRLTHVDALAGLSALQWLYLDGCTSLANADALKDFRALRVLDLRGCGKLTNVDALKGMPALQWLNLGSCSGLTNVDALKGLPALEWLNLTGCSGLRNVAELKGFPALQWLNLEGCTGLANVDGLKDFPVLRWLYLSGCTGLKNVDALSGLPALQWLYLDGCSSLANVDALKGSSVLEELLLTGCSGLTNVNGLKGMPAVKGLGFGLRYPEPPTSEGSAPSADPPNPEIIEEFLDPPVRPEVHPDWKDLQALFGKDVASNEVIEFVERYKLEKAAKGSEGSFTSRDSAYTVMFGNDKVDTVILDASPPPKGYGHSHWTFYSKALPGGLVATNGRRHVERKLGPPDHPRGEVWESGELRIWVHFNDGETAIDALNVSRTRDKL